MKVRWARRASQDLLGLARYVAQDNVTAALQLHERITEAAEKLDQLPERGRPGARAGTRELVITGTPYILVYVIRGDGVSIVRVRHGSQRWPPGKPR